jgi:hypothetical protein
MLAQLPGPIRALESTQDLLEDRHRKNASDEVIRLVQWLMRNTSNIVCVLSLFVLELFSNQIVSEG